MLRAGVWMLVAGLSLGPQVAWAQDATWLFAPGSTDWNTAANWLPATGPATVPTGTAMFGTSMTTNIAFSNSASVGALQFNAGAPAYTLNLASSLLLTITGAGINSPLAKPTILITGNVVGIDRLNFLPGSSAGNAIINNNSSGIVNFFGTSMASSTAANAAITNNNGGFTVFSGITGGSSTAGNATITNLGGVTTFSDMSTADHANIVNNVGAVLTFQDSSTADHAKIDNDGGGVTFSGGSAASNATITNDLGGETIFQTSSTVGHATITNNINGLTEFRFASTAAQFAITNNSQGQLLFLGTSSAGNAMVTTNAGGQMLFEEQSTASESTIITNSDGQTFFADQSTGGQARFITTAGGIVDLSFLSTGLMTAGSIEGAGSYLLGSSALTVGMNNLSTEVSGSISDGGLNDGTGAALIKVGTGTLMLTGLNNTYSGGTSLNGGILAVKSDESLGSGPLSFAGGTLEALTTGGGIVSSKTITLDVEGGTFLADAGTTSILSGTIGDADPIDGAGSWTKTGPGTLELTGSNTYGGGTNLNGGILAVNGDTNLGTGALSFNGGTLEALATGGGIVSSKTITLNVEGGTFLADSGTTSTWIGMIGGAGSWTKLGAGTLILSAPNTYLGGTNFFGGILAVNSDVNLGTGPLSFNGGTLEALATGGGIASNKAVAVNAGGGTFLADAGTASTLSGMIGGVGSLTKLGTGTLILVASNTYSGGTNFNGGILAVNNDANLGTGPLSFDGGTLVALVPGGGIASNQAVTVNAGGGTFFADPGTASTLSGAISGPGLLTKDGDGALILAGANTYSGGTVLTAGILTVHGPQALGFGNVAVNGGTLNADAQAINVRGNYTQTAGGTLQLQVAGAHPGQYDSLSVRKNGQLDGTLELISLGFQPKAGNLLTLVTTGGLLSGRFAQFVDPFAGFDGPHSFVELLYKRNAVQLLFLNLDPAAAALTALYEISFSNANIQRLNLEGRMDDLHHGANGFSSNMKINGATIQTDDRTGVDGKSSKAVVEPILQPEPENRWGVWITGFGDFVSVDADANANGYNFTTGGVSLGVDYRLTDQLVIGVMGEYSRTWTSLQPSGNVDVNSGRGGLYATWSQHAFYLNGAIYAGHNGYASSRVGLAGLDTGTTDGAELSTFISGGFDFHFGSLTVGPVAALQYTYAKIDGFTENDSLASLQIESGSANSLRSDAGFRLFYQWQIGKILVQPSVKAAWEHEYLYSALPITAAFVGVPGSSATVFGPHEGHDSAIVSAGISVQLTSALTIYANYDGQLGRKNYSSNAVTGGIRISF